MNPWTPPQWFTHIRRLGHESLSFPDDDDPRLYSYIRRQAGPHRDSRPHLLSLTRTIGFARNWARSGFPTIEVSGTLFASLACTTIPPDLVPNIGTPWRTFVVMIPSSLQVEVDLGWAVGSQRLVYMAYEQVSDEGGNITLHPIGSPGAGIMRSFKNLGELLYPSTGAGVDTGVAPWMDHCPEELTAADPDKMSLFWRAFVGICIEMMSPTNAIAAKKASKRRMRMRAGVPRGWSFQLSRDVVVDCRERVRQLLDGTAKNGPSIQTLVRGHWKRQAHGPGGKDRKFIHIEPYWRGPEDAPIAVRSHVLKKSDRTDEEPT